MDNNTQNARIEESLVGDRFIGWGIFLIILGPIIGVLSIFYSSFFVGKLISTNGEIEVLMLLGGISTIGVGISLVIIGCSKNIIQKLTGSN